MTTRRNTFHALALLCGLFALMAQPAVKAQTQTPTATGVARDTEKETAIRRLLEVTKTTEQTTATLNMTIQNLRTTNPEIPEEFLTRFRQKIKVADIIDLYVPLYAKYYTIEEINALIAFYTTPLGQKSATTALILLREGAAGAEQYGKRLAMDVFTEMQSAGKIRGATAPSPVTKPAAKPKPKKSGKPGG